MLWRSYLSLCLCFPSFTLLHFFFSSLFMASLLRRKELPFREIIISKFSLLRNHYHASFSSFSYYVRQPLSISKFTSSPSPNFTFYFYCIFLTPFTIFPYFLALSFTTFHFHFLFQLSVVYRFLLCYFLPFFSS